MYGELKKLETATDRDAGSAAISLDGILIAGRNEGLDWQAMRSMQLGQVLDYCIESINQKTRASKASEKPQKRRATQADIDAFFGSRK